MIDLRCSFFVVSSGNLSLKSKRACAPKTESVPVPVRSSRRAPWSRTSRRRSWYWRMLVCLHSSLRSRRLPRPNHEDWREFWPDDTLSTVPRAVAIFLAGTALGVLIAFLFLRGSRSETSAAVFRTPTETNKDSGRIESSADKSRAETEKIILGNIATVPFQELYSVLSARSAKEMAELAAQFNGLPPGRETKTKITTFFTAWAHLDARAAISAAISLKTADAKDAAIAAVVRRADAIAAKSLV